MSPPARATPAGAAALALALAFALGVGCSRAEPGGAAAGAGSGGRATRVVSLMPSGTEVMAALGAAALLVGVDDYSRFPPEVEALPKVGSYLAPNLEAIVRLAPTFVIVDDVHGGPAAALRDAGIETVPCASHALPDVKRALLAVGARLGRGDRATAAVAAIDAAIDAASAAARAQPGPRLRVLAIIDREAGGLGQLVAAGTGSWIDELLAIHGAANALAASAVRYPKLSLEEVLRGRPDAILDLSYAARGPEGLAPWRGVAVPATAQGRVIALSAPYLLAPSPRVAEALADVGRALAPPRPERGR
jgi:iron complex transport system substrate-binding protein